MSARRWGLSRQRLDEFSRNSQQKAAGAIHAGRFDDKIVPVPLSGGRMIDTDEGVREDSTVEALAQLKPVLKSKGSLHAGNSSQISEAASALLLTTPRRAQDLGLKPMARIHTAVVVGSDPTIMLTAPIPATEKALARGGLSLDDIGAFEGNEAFAPGPLAGLVDTGAGGADRKHNGAPLGFWHTLGPPGARLITTPVLPTSAKPRAL